MVTRLHFLACTACRGTRSKRGSWRRLFRRETCRTCAGAGYFMLPAPPPPHAEPTGR